MKYARPYQVKASAHSVTQNLALVVIDQLYFDDLIPIPVPESLSSLIQAGSCVLVEPKKTKSLSVKLKLGFVFKLLEDQPPVEASYNICDVIDQGHPLLTGSIISLLEWISDYYVCSPLEAIYSALPASLRKRPKEYVKLKEFQLQSQATKIRKSALRKKILEYLGQNQVLTVSQLQRQTGSAGIRKTLAELEKAGEIEIYTQFTEPLIPRTRTGYKTRKSLSEADLETFKQAHPRAKRQQSVLTWLVQHQPNTFFADELQTTPDSLNALVKKGILEKIAVEMDQPFHEPYVASKTHQHLTHEQEEVLSPIKKALLEQCFKSFLLFGITGSGKTTIYIEAISQTLQHGKSALMLVPEISLTPQTTARFKAFFGNQVRVLHSGLNNSEKAEAWQRLRSGKASIVIGARSAVFAPLRDLGLIIVDEEHEHSYKQMEHTPTYHARDVALMRGKLENAVCILGSATPSFESYTNALSGKHTLLKLMHRFNKNPLPKVKLVHYPKSEKRSTNLSQALFQAIESKLEQDEQVILFINRRGFAGSILCHDCGYIVECDHCKVPLVYHLSPNNLQCHYCGATKPLVEHCPSCQSDNLAMQRSGTERLEMELGPLFPDKTIQRMDFDTTRTKHAHSQILSRFSEQETDILLGTQMVTKGLDFPNVSLVGVLLGDIGLTLPDFRATERLFSLLSQAAGRAGRGEKQGDVFLQVLNPEHPVFKYVTLGDYEAFYADEIAFRQELFYPPFSRLSKFECSGQNAEKAEQAAMLFKTILLSILPDDGYQCLGPAPAALAYLKGRHRFHILFKQQPWFRLKKEWVREAMHWFRNHHKAFRDISIKLDVDTLSML
jgi:primosomal protein N' (replication factor Y)